MPNEIHAVMQEPQDLYDVALDPKEHKVTGVSHLQRSFCALAAGRQMVGADALPDVVALAHADATWVGQQIGQCSLYQRLVPLAPCGSERTCRPIQNVVKVSSRSVGNRNFVDNCCGLG